jgi:hypothetical protein
MGRNPLYLGSNYDYGQELDCFKRAFGWSTAEFMIDSGLLSLDFSGVVDV